MKSRYSYHKFKLISSINIFTFDNILKFELFVLVFIFLYSWIFVILLYVFFILYSLVKDYRFYYSSHKDSLYTL